MNPRHEKNAKQRAYYQINKDVILGKAKEKRRVSTEPAVTRLDSREYNRRWRARHPERVAELKVKSNAKYTLGWEVVPNRNKRWEADEVAFILETLGHPIRGVAGKLERSIQSVSKRRYVLKKRKLNEVS